MDSRVSIVILNYNGYEDTIECLSSLMSTIAQSEVDVRLIVVDNKSTNDSVKYIGSWIYSKYPVNSCVTSKIEDAINYKVVLFTNNENCGFSGGNNIGIRIASENGSEYVMLLNNDTIVEDGFLFPLLDNLRFQNVAMTGPKIVDYYDHNQYILGGHFEKLKCTSVHYYNTELYSKKNVNFLSGCCWLIKMDAIQTCGLMDENYFLYVEDVDYCYRMVELGYHLIPTKESIIYHKEGKSTIVKPSLYYYNTRNRLYFCQKFKYNLCSKLLFYSYMLINRSIVVLRKKDTFKYVKKALIDYRRKSFGVLK